MENMHISESRNLVGKEGENEVMLNQFKGQVGPGELIWVKLKRESWWPAQVVNENGILDSNKPRKKTAGEVLVRLYGSYKYLYTSPAKCYSELQTVLKQKNGNFFEIFQKSLEQDLPSLKRGKNNGQGSKKVIAASGTNRADGKRSSQNAAQEAKSKITQVVRQPFSSKSDAKNIEAKGGQNGTDGSNKRGVLQQKQKSRTTGDDDLKSGASDAKKPKSLGQSNATTSPKTPKELSARKTRVMQALGLIGPSGSPFRRNGMSAVVSD